MRRIWRWWKSRREQSHKAKCKSFLLALNTGERREMAALLMAKEMAFMTTLGHPANKDEEIRIWALVLKDVGVSTATELGVPSDRLAKTSYLASVMIHSSTLTDEEKANLQLKNRRGKSKARPHA